VRLDLRHRAGGYRVAVKLVGQSVNRDNVVGVQQQDREDRPLLRASQLKWAVLPNDLERSQDPELEQTRTVAAS
jgi:hypothetical protein